MSSSPNPLHASTQGNSAYLGMALALLGATAFAAKAIVAKLIYRHGVDALTLMTWRMLLALPLFAALAWWSSRGQAALTAADKWRILGLGFLGYYASSMLDFYGLMFISASLERLILYLNPSCVVLIAVIFLKQRIDAKQACALALTYLGVLLVFGQELGLATGPVIWGSLLVFASALTYAFYLLGCSQMVKRLGAMRLTGWASSVACVLCLLHFACFRPWGSLAVNSSVLWLSVTNALLCTFAPVLMVMMAIERIGPGLAAQIGMVGPLITIALSIALLGEPLTVWLIAGTALVLTGVALLARWR